MLPNANLATSQKLYCLANYMNIQTKQHYTNIASCSTLTTDHVNIIFAPKRFYMHIFCMNLNI